MILHQVSKMQRPSFCFIIAKKGRGLSSLLISRVGKENKTKGTKKRKLNDGQAEEEKKDEEENSDEENEEISELLENGSNATSQFHRSNTMIPKSGGKIIGTRNAKKRQYGQF